MAKSGTIRLALEIPVGVIASLMTSAIESGDPVTTASRGGWCAGIYWKSQKHEPPFEVNHTGSYRGPWYADAARWLRPFTIEIVEVVNETTGRKKSHFVTNRHFREGLSIMARKCPHAFAQVLQDETDAPCADTFLQCVLFGEEKYG